jgi:hypothetical protein
MKLILKPKRIFLLSLQQEKGKFHGHASYFARQLTQMATVILPSLLLQLSYSVVPHVALHATQIESLNMEQKN